MLVIDCMDATVANVLVVGGVVVPFSSEQDVFDATAAAMNFRSNRLLRTVLVISASTPREGELVTSNDRTMTSAKEKIRSRSIVVARFLFRGTVLVGRTCGRVSGVGHDVVA